MMTTTTKKSSEQEEELARSRRRLIVDPPQFQLDSGVACRRAWALRVPEEPGVYLIWDMRGVLYVGQARDLKRRFLQHLEYSHNAALRAALLNPVGETQFSWIRETQPDDLEKQLIRRFQPLCNERLYRNTRTN